MKNQLKAGVIFSYISTGITVLIQLIYLPIMIRILGQSEYADEGCPKTHPENP